MLERKLSLASMESFSDSEVRRNRDKYQAPTWQQRPGPPLCYVLTTTTLPLHKFKPRMSNGRQSALLKGKEKAKTTLLVSMLFSKKTVRDVSCICLTEASQVPNQLPLRLCNRKCLIHESCSASCLTVTPNISPCRVPKRRQKMQNIQQQGFAAGHSPNY